MLLHQPAAAPTSSSSNRSSTLSSTSIPHNPTSPQTEEAIKQFMNEVFEIWVKTLMNPFYRIGMQIKSPVFKQRVAAAGRKWL
jgi:trafficking protein particle complex subunit 2